MLNYVPQAGLAPPPAATPSEPAPFAWLPMGLAFLRRNLLLIGLCAALGLGAAVTFVALATSEYTATATLVIDSRRTHPTRPQPITLDAQSENVFVESQVEILRGQGTLRAVVARLGLERDPRFWNPDAERGLVGDMRASLSALLRGADDMAGLEPGAEARATVARLLSRKLNVRRVGMTSVVEISFTSPSRRLSADVANAFTAVYIDQQLGGNAETTRRAGSWLEERIRELRDNAVIADRAVQEYKAAHNIIEMGGALLSDQELTETIELLAAARARFAEATARAQRLESATPGSVIQGSVAEALQNPVITRLRQQYLEASRREAEIAQRQGANHGAAVNLRVEMAELERVMQNELGRIAEVHRSERAVAEVNMRGQETQLAALIQTATRANVERSELRSLQSTADASRAIFENFLQRFTQAVQDQSYPIADARTVSEAVPPLERSKPKGLIIIAAGLAVGLVLGVGLAILRDALDGRLRTAEQLAASSGAARVWEVAESRRLRLPGHGHWLTAARAARAEGHSGLALPAAFREATSQPDSAMAEAVQGLRATLARMTARGSEIKVLGISGVEPGDGASSLAANVALAHASAGRRTVLVDWRARDAGLFAGSEAGAGFTDAQSGLRFMPIPADAGGDMAEHWRAAARLIAVLRRDHDLVVVDLPPMSGQGSVAALHDLLDGFVLVTRWGRTNAARVSEVMGRTAAVDSLFLGAVLNRADMRRMRLHGAPGRAPESASV